MENGNEEPLTPIPNESVNGSSESDINFFPMVNGRITQVGSYYNGYGHNGHIPLPDNNYSSDDHDVASHTDSGVSTFTDNSTTAPVNTDDHVLLPPVPKRPVYKLNSQTPC